MLQVQRDGLARRFQAAKLRGIPRPRRLHAVREHRVHDGDDADGQRADGDRVRHIPVRGAARRVLGGARVRRQVDTEHIAGFLQVLDHLRGRQVERRGSAGQSDQHVELRFRRVRAQPHVLGPHRRRGKTLRAQAGNGRHDNTLRR